MLCGIEIKTRRKGLDFDGTGREVEVDRPGRKGWAARRGRDCPNLALLGGREAYGVPQCHPALSQAEDLSRYLCVLPVLGAVR